MSLSPNGNEIWRRSIVFDVSDLSQVGEVRRQAQELASILRMTELRSTQLSIIANELSTNLARHAKSGQIIMRAARQFGETFIELISVDRGPGIPDLDRAFTDGVTTGTTPGTGLGAVRRLSDLFDVSTAETGTILVCEMHIDDESAKRAMESRFRLSGICIPMGHETVAGDLYATHLRADSFDLLVVDGLGHGPIAHEAAVLAEVTFCEMEASLPLDRKLQLLHGALRSSRGAAVSIASLGMSIDHTDIDFVGVGNVRAVVCEPSRERTLLTHPGTAGLQFKPRPVNRTEWNGLGCFVMHSDGLQSRWNSQNHSKQLNHHPAIFAASLYRDYNRNTDDITVVAVRYGSGQDYQ